MNSISNLKFWFNSKLEGKFKYLTKLLLATRPKPCYYTLTLDKLLKNNIYEFELISKWRFKLFKLEVNSNKIHNNKDKSQGNKKEPFYCFDIDSYTRINYNDLLQKNKRKKYKKVK